MRPGAALST
jgi:hypothetical protein